MEYMTRNTKEDKYQVKAYNNASIDGKVKRIQSIA